MDGPPLSQQEFEEVYARVPRLTVEVVLRGVDGVLLTRRTTGPCAGLWHLPGGTVRFGEPLEAAVRRTAAGELGVEVEVGPLLGVIEYPSHYLRGLDSPVGLAYQCVGVRGDGAAGPDRGWFVSPPGPMHDEQVEFLVARGILAPRP